VLQPQNQGICAESLNLTKKPFAKANGFFFCPLCGEYPLDRPLTRLRTCAIMKKIKKMSIDRAFSKKGDYHGEKSDL
jgi:hypothetical protein